MQPSILLVDDHPGFRAEARATLESDGYDVIGEAASCAAALVAVDRLRPGLVLLDIGLPDGSGLDIVGRIREIAPTAVVVLISGRPTSDYGGRVAAARADGFLDKATLTNGALDDLLDSAHDQ